MSSTVLTRIGRLEKDLGELIASHEKGKSLDYFRKWKDDPVGFCRDVLKAEPWSKKWAPM